MSRGPIVMDEISEVGKGEIEALQMIEFDNGKSFYSADRYIVFTQNIDSIWTKIYLSCRLALQFTDVIILLFAC